MKKIITLTMLLVVAIILSGCCLFGPENAAPANVSVSGGIETIEAYWTNPSTATLYNIVQVTESGQDWSGATIDRFAATTNWMGEFAAGDYQLRIGSEDVDGNVLWAETEYVVVLMDTFPPATLSAVIDADGNVYLSWDGDADSYLVERIKDGETWDSALSCTQYVNEMTDESVLEDRTYWYRVNSIKDGYEPGVSEPVSIYVPVMENPEARVFLDMSVYGGGTFEEYLVSISFTDYTFGETPRNNVGTYSAVEVRNVGGTYEYDVIISNQSGTSCDYVRDYGLFDVSFLDSLTTGIEDEFTLWYSTSNNIYIEVWTTEGTNITVHGACAPKNDSGSSYTWTGTLTPQA